MAVQLLPGEAVGRGGAAAERRRRTPAGRGRRAARGPGPAKSTRGTLGQGSALLTHTSLANSRGSRRGHSRGRGDKLTCLAEASAAASRLRARGKGWSPPAPAPAWPPPAPAEAAEGKAKKCSRKSSSAPPGGGGWPAMAGDGAGSGGPTRQGPKLPAARDKRRQEECEGVERGVWLSDWRFFSRGRGRRGVMRVGRW